MRLDFKRASDRKKEQMTEIIIDREACKACGYCVHFCPQGALSFSEEMNKQSYTPVQVDEEKCIYCGTCYTVCPDTVFEIREVNA